MSSLPFTQAPADPQLKDVLDALRKNIFLSLACHHIGTIQSFNKDKQTATATINYSKTVYTLDPSSGLYTATQVNYPILVDCPAIVLGGGHTSLTFPIETGDECLVLFNDRDMDTWFSGGSGSPPSTPRLHSFADAIVLVGIRSLGNVLTNYDGARAVLQNGTTLVGVGADKIKLANQSTTLNTLLQNLLSILEGLMTTPAVPGSPCTLDPSVITQLSNLGTQIGGLLE